MDPRGAEPARRIVPRGLRGPEPLPALEPVPGVALVPVRAARRRDGQGPRVRGGHGCPVDAPRVPAGPRAAPRPGRPVLDGQDLAVRVRRERACGALPPASGRDPGLARRLHGRPRRVQRGHLETEAGPASLAERRVRGRRGPCEFEAVRGRPPSDAPARVMREVSALDSNRLSAILLCLGAVLGLVGATPTGFTLFYATLGWGSFGVALLRGT